VTSTFDLNAASFERHRALPSGVPEAIRKAIWESTGARSSACVLDLGAGSGRIGRAFVEAGDAYVGVDFSLPMLREFHARNPAACLLQADGGQLPFRNGSFELVLLMQVLSGAHNRRSLLSETARVAARGGSVIVGHTVTPPEGVDARMKRQLAVILEEMSVGAHGQKEAREQSLEWLRTQSTRSIRSTAASWTARRTSREFLVRHGSGAQFSTLPAAVQTEALKRLSVWADKTCGSLDEVFSETHSFELHVFVVG